MQVRRPSTTDSSSSQIPAINLPHSSPSRPPVDTPTTRTSRDTFQNLSGNRQSLDVSPASFPSISPQSAYPHTPSSLQPAPATRSDLSVSPASSNQPRKQSSQGVTPVPSETLQVRREHNARVSFFDPSNQASLDRLIASEPGAEGGEGEEETAQATMTSVEEMLEGYEWASDDVIGRKTVRGTADLIEARLLDELMALEKVDLSCYFLILLLILTTQANIHSFLESDDRINIVVKYLDEAIGQLDNMDSLVSSYKIHLNVSILC
jgi:exocyst complex component 1